ncbi:MAG: tRNA (guanine37-N1)-methyltransferase [Planctomycetota bacterium]
MLFAVLSLFPEALEAYTRSSILGIAGEKGLVEIKLVDFRDFTRDRHRTADDRPYGGGPGMVLKPEPIIDAVEWLEREHGTFRRIMLSPGGERFDQNKAEEFTGEERILLLCGRYEGFDERIRTEMEWEELSVGDFVLSGGELPALTVIEAVTRLMPGVLGNAESAEYDSFANDGGLEYPQYTRPQNYRGIEVPKVLLSGDHAKIAAWRTTEAERKTRAIRPDLGERSTRVPNPTSD